MSEKVETKTNFDQTASPLKGIKNIMTPAGAVMRVTDTDLKWFNHFYTFEAQGNKCYQSIKKIAKEMDRAVSAAQDRIDKLQELGLLAVGKEPFKDGWRNTYTCTPIDVIVSRMTDAPVTPQDKPLKKSQLNSLLKKSGKVDSHTVNRGIKAMAKTIANRDLSDEEVMQFAFQIATEKLAALGWNIETIIEESNDEDDLQPVTDGTETAAPAAGKPDGVSNIHSDQHDDIPSDDDAVNQDEIAIFDENNVVTEAFINGADNPRIGRNDDGTVQNYRYTYARAKTAQAFQDGYASPQAISDSWSIWFNAARPEYIPVHLLPVHERPVLAGYFDDDEEF
ncbi:hypothetical protein [Klebsiella quasipneumoniae]|uniref:hypothetical protein n=1 Tax=Klebsiella quasipneumoniae TaxID=1463165 RepID=UPI001868EAEE|nr:hypothetical protein [Klebsiella quasipneumoniae]HBQ8813842.1 hypothetical protein [Klebsiella quasipneumoniae]HDZ9754640.1 hypothetical protein [Klebsiella quasipneumoniae subsp. similipneumoniae]